MNERQAFDQGSVSLATYQASVGRVKDKPVQAKPPKDWEDLTPKQQVEFFRQKIRGRVIRINAAGYGVIKHPEFGEVMWRV